jgi:hypothetical protein
VEEALTWFETLRPMGVEGSSEGRGDPVSAGESDWAKVKNRQTTEVIVGAAIGPIEAPQAVVDGLWRDEELIVVGRTTALSAARPRRLRASQTGRPEASVAGFDSRRPLRQHRQGALTKDKPKLVLGVAADSAVNAGGR